MQNDLFSGFNSRSKDFMERASQFNASLLHQFSRAADIQMEAMRRYADIASEQARRLTEVRDLDDLRELSAGQADALKEISEQVSSDWQAWQEYFAEASEQLKSGMTNEQESSESSQPESSDTSERDNAA